MRNVIGEAMEQAMGVMQNVRKEVDQAGTMTPRMVAARYRNRHRNDAAAMRAFVMQTAPPDVDPAIAEEQYRTEMERQLHQFGMDGE